MRHDKICEHGRIAYTCGEGACHGRGVCQHKRQKSSCRICKGSQICEHGTNRSTCRLCSFRSWARVLINSAKARSKKEGIPFNLTFEQDSPRIIRQLKKGCPVFGVAFSKTGIYAANSATLDKFYPERGYVRGNVFILSKKANTIKQNASWDEVLAVSEWMRKTASRITKVQS